MTNGFIETQWRRVSCLADMASVHGHAGGPCFPTQATATSHRGGTIRPDRFNKSNGFNQVARSDHAPQRPLLVTSTVTSAVTMTGAVTSAVRYHIDE